MRECPFVDRREHHNQGIIGRIVDTSGPLIYINVSELVVNVYITWGAEAADNFDPIDEAILSLRVLRVTVKLGNAAVVEKVQSLLQARIQTLPCNRSGYG